MPLASMLVGHEVEVAALLDGDETGRKEARSSNAFSDSTTECSLSATTHDSNTTGEIEDLFPDDYFMAAVKEAYGSRDFRFNADEKATPNIVDRITALSSARG